MTPDNVSTVWVPVCCGRVMRCNTFRQPNGGAYAALVCTVCNKNITLEQQPLQDMNNFGAGAALLGLIGAPKPPKTERRKAGTDVGADEPTL
jgi:hypothetical protein